MAKKEKSSEGKYIRPSLNNRRSTTKYTRKINATYVIVNRQRHTLAVGAVAIVAVLADAAVGARKIFALGVLMTHGHCPSTFVHV